jgi:hypothetical protein
MRMPRAEARGEGEWAMAAGYLMSVYECTEAYCLTSVRKSEKRAKGGGEGKEERL